MVRAKVCLLENLNGKYSICGGGWVIVPSSILKSLILFIHFISKHLSYGGLSLPAVLFLIESLTLTSFV